MNLRCRCRCRCHDLRPVQRETLRRRQSRQPGCRGGHVAPPWATRPNEDEERSRAPAGTRIRLRSLSESAEIFHRIEGETPVRLRCAYTDLPTLRFFSDVSKILWKRRQPGGIQRLGRKNALIPLMRFEARCPVPEVEKLQLEPWKNGR